MELNDGLYEGRQQWPAFTKYTRDRIKPGIQFMTMPLEILSKRVNPRCRILLVDDDSHLLELNAVALIRFGYDVDTAEDGAAS